MQSRLEDLILTMKRHAESGTWSGCEQTPYFDACRRTDNSLGLQLIFSRDVGHHSSGWWKNPEYQRCRHLSVSFFDPETLGNKPRDRKRTSVLLQGFFGMNKRWLWCEPPYSEHGKKVDVWHYRLFADQGWTPILPIGEVYNRDFTEAGWLSYSDLKVIESAEREGGKVLRTVANVDR
jgi:hypothetical protein